MTRLIAVILFCAGIFCLTAEPPVGQLHAQVPMTGAGLGKPSGGGFTPSCGQSSTFLTAATGVTLTADKTRYDNLICRDLVGVSYSGGGTLFAALDVLYVWAAPSATNAANINVVNPGTFNGTPNGTPSFSAYNGYTGDASTFYIDSGFNPTTAPSPKFVQNSATVGVYVLTNRSSGTTVWNIGCTVGACTDGPLFAAYNGGSNSAALNSVTNVSGGPTNAQGVWNLTRTTSIAQAIFLNSGENTFGSTADTSASPTNANIIFFGFNTGFGLVGDQMSAGWIGKGVGGSGAGSGVDSCNLNNAINNYMTSLGINVYTNSAC